MPATPPCVPCPARVGRQPQAGYHKEWERQGTEAAPGQHFCRPVKLPLAVRSTYEVGVQVEDRSCAGGCDILTRLSMHWQRASVLQHARITIRGMVPVGLSGLRIQVCAHPRCGEGRRWRGTRRTPSAAPRPPSCPTACHAAAPSVAPGLPPAPQGGTAAGQSTIN
jgi:hypothetical protein